MESNGMELESIMETEGVGVICKENTENQKSTFTPKTLNENASTSGEHRCTVSNASTSGNSVCVEEMETCFYCEQKEKRVKFRLQPLQFTDREALIRKLKKYGDGNRFCKKLQELSSDKIYFHHFCQVPVVNTIKNENSKNMQKYYHNIAFEKMKSFISSEVIKRKRLFSFQYICKYYSLLLDAVVKNHGNTSKYKFSFDRLESKLLESFNEEIDIIKVDGRKYLKPKIIIINASLCELLPDDEDETLQKAASILRRTILSMDKKELPDNLPTDLLNGKCKVPKRLLDFYCLLLGRDSNNYEQQANSLAKDLIQNMTNSCEQKANYLAEDLIHNMTNNYEQKTKSLEDLIHNMTNSCEEKGNSLSKELIYNMTNRYEQKGNSLSEDLIHNMTNSCEQKGNSLSEDLIHNMTNS